MWKKASLEDHRSAEKGQRMDREPVVVKESTREWETWPDEDVAKRGLVYWKTLESGDLTHSEALTMGIALVPSAESLHEHRHRQAEIYLVLEGTGSVTIDSKTRPVAAGQRSSYRATPCTPARTRERRIYRSLTFSPRTRPRRSSTSSTNNPEPHT